MPFALVQENKATGGAGNPSVTLAAGPTAGNLVVAVAVCKAPLTDPAGYTRRDAIVLTSYQLATVNKVAGAGESATVAFTSGVASWEMQVMEWSGNAGAGSEFDNKVDGATATATSRQPGSLTPAQINELLIVTVAQDTANGGSEAIDSGFTLLNIATFAQMTVGYKIKTDAAAENPITSWLSSVESAASMQAYKPLPTLAARPQRLGMPQAVARRAFR